MQRNKSNIMIGLLRFTQFCKVCPKLLLLRVW